MLSLATPEVVKVIFLNIGKPSGNINLNSFPAFIELTFFSLTEELSSVNVKVAAKSSISSGFPVNVKLA